MSWEGPAYSLMSTEWPGHLPYQRIARTSLVAHWLRIWLMNLGDTCLIPVRELRDPTCHLQLSLSYNYWAWMPQLKKSLGTAAKDPARCTLRPNTAKERNNLKRTAAANMKQRTRKIAKSSCRNHIALPMIFSFSYCVSSDFNLSIVPASVILAYHPIHLFLLAKLRCRGW